MSDKDNHAEVAEIIRANDCGMTTVAELRDLIRRLKDGMSEWGDQEDGVPDFAWDAYAEAVKLVTGKVLVPEDQ